MKIKKSLIFLLIIFLFLFMFLKIVYSFDWCYQGICLQSYSVNNCFYSCKTETNCGDSVCYKIKDYDWTWTKPEGEFFMSESFTPGSLYFKIHKYYSKDIGLTHCENFLFRWCNKQSLYLIKKDQGGITSECS